MRPRSTASPATRWPAAASSSSACAASSRCTSSRAARWPTATSRSGIADVLAPRQRWRVEFEGEANHAGTTAMEDRRDALLPAARFVLAVDEAARARPGAVGTVGRIEVHPGSTNSIPGHGRRHARRARAGRGRPSTRWSTSCGRPAPTRRSAWSRATRARAFDAGLRELLRDAAAARGLPAGDLPSYAGHDAGILAPARAVRHAVRPQPHRRQPHARRVGVRERLPGRRPGADGRGGRGADRRVALSTGGVDNVAASGVVCG